MRKLLTQIAATLTALALSAPLVAAQPIRLTAFGDSLVQGYGLPQGEGFVPQLEAWLQGQGADVTVVNAGVSGETTAGGAARIDWTMADRPDGIIVLLGGNDMLRGLPPELTRANLTRIVETAQAGGAEVMLIGMNAPLNYGAQYKAGFDGIYSDLRRSHDVLLHPSAFAGIQQETDGDPTGFGRFMQNDGIHPNARGVAANIEAMGPVLLRLLRRIGAEGIGAEGDEQELRGDEG
ncbi:MAG: arylesterase [Alphaproteobacteria bacterium MedPE-SWcel]|nr:MAG: arylesterase [Alphaproteobacteria bacterium MedPE-SWcel]